ncbi:MAG: PrsW family intramembrane metalloprotease [Treponemataceae bacterium]|nr:PrsW family intramembrane metalloprotease [Treponemataceae bacterium]
MNLNVYAPMLLCLVPLVTTFLLLAILVPGISVLREFLAVLAGLLAFVPIVILQFLFLNLRIEMLMRANLFLSIIHSLVFFGLIEEGVKAASLLVLKSRGENLRNFFAYSILAGMALGCFESVVYLLTAVGTRPQVSAEFLQMIFLRMATALVIHALCAGLGGLCIFYSKNIRRNFSPLVFAIVIHGIYDFFAANAYPLKYFSVAVILLAVLECRIFYLRTRENLASEKSSASGFVDSEKTIEIPKSPALVISVKGERKNSQEQIQNAQMEEKMFFRKNVEEGAEDFEKIQAEAEAAIKAEESKNSFSKKSAKPKKDSEKTVVKNSAPKKSAEKTIAKNTSKKSSTEKNSSNKDSAKRDAKISQSKIPAAKSKSASEKKSAQTKSSTRKSFVEKAVVKKTAATKKATSEKKRAPATKKSKGV